MGGGRAEGIGRGPVGPGDETPDPLNHMLMQVFSAGEAGRAALWADVQAKFAAGGPVWHRAKYTVVENAFLGVPGGWEVEVLWVFNATCTRWEGQHHM